jgi:sugar phosphate isomerase/epimerase
VIVAASTRCFPDLPLTDTLQKLVDLEYTSVEIEIDELGNKFRPSQVAADLERSVDICRNTLRLTPAAYNLNITAEGEAYYDQFTAICRLAKATKVVPLIVPSGELGTPFNEEVERLQRLVSIAAVEGCVVGVKTEGGRISQDAATITVLCEHVKGLGVTLDPSHFVYGPQAGSSYDSIMKYVCHVQLRDTKKDELQVRVGQGEVEYGRLVALLEKDKYSQALCVDMQPIPEVDHMAEMRKMRLLLESLL